MKRFKVLMLSTVLATVLLGVSACGMGDGKDNTGNTEAPYEDETNKDVNEGTNNNGTDSNMNNTQNNGNTNKNSTGNGTSGAGRELKNAGRNLVDSVKDAGDAIIDGVDNVTEPNKNNGGTNSSKNTNDNRVNP